MGKAVDGLSSVIKPLSFTDIPEHCTEQQDAPSSGTRRTFTRLAHIWAIKVKDCKS